MQPITKIMHPITKSHNLSLKSRNLLESTPESQLRLLESELESESKISRIYTTLHYSPWLFSFQDYAPAPAYKASCVTDFNSEQLKVAHGLHVATPLGKSVYTKVYNVWQCLAMLAKLLATVANG